MKRPCLPKCRAMSILGWLQIVLGGLVILVSLLSLIRFYYAGFFLTNEDICKHFHVIDAAKTGPREGPDLAALSDRIGEVLDKVERLQEKLESAVKEMEKSKEKLDKTSITKLEHKRYLEQQVIRPLYVAHVALRRIRLPEASTAKEEPLINAFVAEEIRKYITPKPNRDGKANFYGTERVFNTIGHACVLRKKELEKYMDYEIGSFCNDDWDLAQKLMLNGCDPLPRRRCLARAPKAFQPPYPINESLWRLPDDRNVRWGNYKCRSFQCLKSQNPSKGYSKCAGCFEMEKERLKWEAASVSPGNFLIRDVLAAKARGEIRIGLDLGVAGTGTFAARMREQNITIVTAALNLGAPFSETIALRGLVPLYATPSQRLPFFDNTMDLIHSAGFFDGGWIDFLLMDFVLFDWDRVLRPGGLLWIDRFLCKRGDLDEFLYMFLQFRYKKHKWVVSPKSSNEVYFSALLEKPPRAI